jgi:deferrochelatase/peroxidase EfeB
VDGDNYLILSAHPYHLRALGPPGPETSKNRAIGRRKLDGAPPVRPVSSRRLDLDARDKQGDLVIAANAHVRLAAPQSDRGAVIIRGAFSYNNGTTPCVERWPPWRQALEYDAGLLVLAYQRDPRTAFIPIFSKLAESDALNQFTTHTASAVFAVPSGVDGSTTGLGGPCSLDILAIQAAWASTAGATQGP